MSNNYVLRFKPEMMMDNVTICASYSVEKIEVENIFTIIKKLYKNDFIKLADSDGIRRYEKLYNILTDVSLSLEDRRKKVLNQIVFLPPITRLNLPEKLDLYFGVNNYTYEIAYNEFAVYIEIETYTATQLAEGIKRLREIIPANMTLYYSVKYTHLYLHRKFTYEDLTKFTYGDLGSYN